MIDAPETTAAPADARAILQRAYAGLLQCSAATLLAWKAGLSDSRLRQLDAFERKGLRLGLQLTIRDKWIATVILTDAAGAIVALDTIDLATAGASVTVN